MIYTVIETLEDGRLRYVRDRSGSARITTKSWAEHLEREARKVGKNVEVKKWEKLADSDTFVSEHNQAVYEAKRAARNARLGIELGPSSAPNDGQKKSQSIDITSLVQTLASYGVPSAQIDQVRELGRDGERMDRLSAKAALQKYDCGYKASFTVSVNGMADQGYHTDFRAAVDAAAV